MVAEDIEKLHVHRHFGVDIVVITQHPNRMNKTIRDLVGRHVHVRRLFGGRRAMLYEWDCAHNPNSGFRDAVKHVWNYPKEVFNLYVSAELHTKPKAVVPKALLIAPLALVVAVYLGWRGFKSVSGGFGIGPAKAVAAPGAPGAGGGSGSAGGAGAASKEPVSRRWRVAGRYAVDGSAYVLLADSEGRFRSELSDGFKGGQLRVEGVVDGERVAVWSGEDGADNNTGGGAKK